MVQVTFLCRLVNIQLLIKIRLSPGAMCPVTYCLAVWPTGHACAARPMAPCHAALRPTSLCGLAVRIPVFIVAFSDGAVGRAISAYCV